MVPCQEVKDALISLQQDKGIFLEGNILKVLESGGDEEFESYLKTAIERDKESRRKRLDVTKSIQAQNAELKNSQTSNETLMEQLRKALAGAEDNKELMRQQNMELTQSREENQRINEELKRALEDAQAARKQAEEARAVAENDLDMLQKKNQFQLIGKIVKIALFVIMGVGITTTVMYFYSLHLGKDTQIIGSTWSNMFGILLTNAFSIIGTIMGVKYASENKTE